MRRYQQIVEARLDIRDVNDQYIETVAAAMPDEYRSKFRQEALERAYPRVYRPTQGERIFKAALELDELSTEVREAIQTLEVAFQNELTTMNARLVRLLHEQEPADELHRAAVFAARGSSARPERPENVLREGFREREQIEQRYVKQLQSLLTPEQFRSLPGARRFLDDVEQKRKPHQAMGAAARPEMQKKGDRVEKQRERLGTGAPPAGGGAAGTGTGTGGGGGGKK
jgi:hypothetical protein